MSSKIGLLILGFGGHARSVANVALSMGYRELLFVDDNAKPNESFLGYPVCNEFTDKLPANWACMPAAGDNRRRQLQIEYAATHGWNIAMLIAPSAHVGIGAVIEKGTLVAHHAYVGPMAAIGTGCIVNTGAVIEHECAVDDFSHVSVNASIAGRSRLGRYGFIGVGSTVIDGITLGDDITVGAGAVVTKSTNKPGTYIGVPAKLLK